MKKKAKYIQIRSKRNEFLQKNVVAGTSLDGQQITNWLAQYSVSQCLWLCWDKSHFEFKNKIQFGKNKNCREGDIDR